MTALPRVAVDHRRSGTHEVGFRGAVVEGPVDVAPHDLLVGDDALEILCDVPASTRSDRTGRPPRWSEAAQIASAVPVDARSRLIAVGSGAVLDVAKQAWLLAGATAGLVLVPGGDEPWRAFTAFTSLYDPDGVRRSRSDPALRTATVVLDPRVRAARPASTDRLARADTAVQAIEVLVGTRATGWGRQLAAAGLRAAATTDPPGLAPTDGLVAAGFVAEAFGASCLGLAHAIASPLGARLGRAHDVANVVLGPAVVEHWGDAVEWTAVAAALGCAPDATDVAERLRALGRDAAVPGLQDLASSQAQVLDLVLPAALRSSGIPWLPFPVDQGAVEQVVRRAWRHA